MKHQERGFTLNQLTISLAIIGALAAIGLPGIVQWIPNYRLTRAARALVLHIQRAKLKAIQSNAVYYLDFDLDGDGNLERGACMVWEDRNDNHHKEHQERSEAVLALEPHAGIHFKACPRDLGGPEHGPNNTQVDAGGGDGVTFPENRIKFNPVGTCSTGTIYLHSSKGRTFAIRLRYNGLTQLWRHDGSGWARW